MPLQTIRERRRERRRRARYPLAIDLSYSSNPDRLTTLSGMGMCEDISSAGLRFRCDQTLLPSSPINLALRWPASPRTDSPLRLLISGVVIWSRARQVGVAIRQHSFDDSSEIQWPSVARRLSTHASTAERNRPDAPRRAAFVIEGDESYGFLAAVLDHHKYVALRADVAESVAALTANEKAVALLVTGELDPFAGWLGRFPIIYTGQASGPLAGFDGLFQLERPFTYENVHGILKAVAAWRRKRQDVNPFSGAFPAA